MSNSSRETFRQRRNEMNREMSANKRAAGFNYAGRSGTKVEADWQRQLGEMPDDTRSLTARVLGDPIPGDPRAPWRPAVSMREGR